MKQIMRNLFVLITFMVLAGNAQAITLSASVDNHAIPGIDCSNSNSGPSVSCASPTTDLLHVGSATTSQSGISLLAQSSYNSGNTIQTASAGTMIGTVRFDDTNDLSASGVISLSLPLNLSGTCEFVGNNNINQCDIEVQVRLNGFNQAGQWRFNEADGLLKNVGLLNGFTDTSFAGQISPFFTNIPINTDVELFISLQLIATSGDSSGNAIPGTTRMNFLNTLELVSDGPVFTELPSNISVNSTDFQIENNLLPQGSNQIPEPGTIALFGIGLLGLGIAARRRKAA